MSKKTTIFILFFTISILSATTYFVKTAADGGNDSNSGLSWSNAKATVQAAINSSAVNDEILIKYGTYNITNQIDLSSNRKIISDDGDGTCFADAEPDFTLCILDANNSSRIFYLHGSSITNSAVINGLKIYRGTENYYSGGFLIENGADPIIENCWVIDNTSTSPSLATGGGFCIDNANPTIVNNLITENVIDAEDGFGGGVYLEDSDAAIINNVFCANDAEEGGEAIYCSSGNPVIKNNIIVDHLSYYSTQAVYNYSGNLNIYNNCLYNNSSNFYNVTSIDGIYEDPKFTDAENSDFTLSYESPCIDAGYETFTYDETENHHFGWKEDIGVFEYSGNRVKKEVTENGELLFGGNVRAKINITGINSLSVLDITVHPGELHPQNSYGVQRWFDINPTGDIDEFDITLSYLDSELNNNDENALFLYRWDGDSFGDAKPVDDYDLSDNWLQVNGETDFSDWIISGQFDIDDFPGHCLDFDGSDDYVEIPDDSSFNFSDEITMEMWIKNHSGAHNSRPMKKGGIEFLYYDENLEESSGKGYQVKVPTTESADWFEYHFDFEHEEWFHISWTYSSTDESLKMYINGELNREETVTGSIINNSDNIYLSGASGANRFPGSIDEVRLWNVARDSVQIRENMYLPLIGIEAGLISYWQFNEGTGTVLEDKINGNNGTLNNMDEADWIDSSIPFGDGISNTQTETAGTVDFPETGLSIYFNSQNSAEITVTRLDTSPNINPEYVNDVFDSQYWIVNRYGDGDFNADLTFSVSENISSSDENNPSQIAVFSRDSSADGDWEYLTSADSVDASAEEATFAGIISFSQFLICRFNPIDKFPGNGLEFDGIDDYIDVGDKSSLSLQYFTLSCWFKRTGDGVTVSTGQGGVIAEPLITKGRGGGCEWANCDMNYFLGIKETDKVLVADFEDINNGSNHPVIGITVIEDSVWYHAAAAYDGTTWQLFLNGNLEAESVENATPRYDSFQQNSIGSTIDSDNDPAGYFKGLMDEVSIWNAALDSIQVREKMHLNLDHSETNLVSYWQFNEGTGSLASDKISFNNGILQDMDEDDWIDSTIPFGEGMSDTQTETAGSIEFTDTGLSMYFNSQNGAEITVSRIDLSPNQVPDVADEVFDTQYWIVHRFGEGSFNADLTFTLSEDLTSENEAEPEKIKLFTRSSTSNTDWFYLSYASSINAVSDEVTFDGISEFSQFVICRKIPPDSYSGTALEFDGMNDYIEIPHHYSLDIVDEITFETWIKTHYSTPNNRTIKKGEFDILFWDQQYEASSGRGFQIRLPGTSNPNWIEYNYDFSNYGWYHVCWTYSAEESSLKMYVNGELDKEEIISGSITANSDDLVLAELYGSYRFCGKLDEMRIWNVARDSVQIRKNMHLPLTGLESGLVSYWQFNEGSGTTLYDKIDGNHGTLINMLESAWITSTIPLGEGVSNTQTETAGTVDFLDTGLSIYFNSHNSAEITVTRIDTIPNINPTEPDEVFDAQYWIVNRFGTGSFDADLTFTINEDITAEDESNPVQISLFTRSSNADTNWVQLTEASSVNAATDEATFDGITEFSQFIIGCWQQSLDPPQNVTITVSDSVYIYWDAVSGANSYNI